MSQLGSDELQAYLKFAEDLMRRAGDIARKHFSHDVVVDVKDEDNTPVTVADTAINQLVIDEIAKAYPHIGVLAEEQSNLMENADKLLWVCDPIDGTIPYTLHVPTFTGCLALVQDGEAVVGVVYDYAGDRMFSAAKGCGVRLNGEPFTVPARTPLKMIELESWPKGVRDVTMLRAKLFEHGYQLPNYCSYAFASMLVAQNRIEGGVYAGGKPWDGAASRPILRELGIEMTDFTGKQPRFDGPVDGLIVARPELLKLILGAV